MMLLALVPLLRSQYGTIAYLVISNDAPGFSPAVVFSVWDYCLPSHF